MYVLVFSCSKDDTKTENSSNFIIPSGVITQERGIELSNAWSAKTAKLFNKSTNAKYEDDVKSQWWSLEDMRNYLDYAENEAKEKGYLMDGVRVYYAAYPEKNGQSTMFIAPTGYKNTSEASSFFMSLIGSNKDIPVPPLNEGTGGDGGYPQ